MENSELKQPEEKHKTNLQTICSGCIHNNKRDTGGEKGCKLGVPTYEVPRFISEINQTVNLQHTAGFCKFKRKRIDEKKSGVTVVVPSTVLINGQLNKDDLIDVFGAQFEKIISYGSSSLEKAVPLIKELFPGVPYVYRQIINDIDLNLGAILRKNTDSFYFLALETMDQFDTIKQNIKEYYRFEGGSFAVTDGESFLYGLTLAVTEIGAKNIGDFKARLEKNTEDWEDYVGIT